MPKCGNLILHCMDYRLQESINKWIEERGLFGDIDRIAFGGPGLHHEIALQFIDIGCRAHGAKNVYIVQHEDCGAYNGHAAFPSLEAEREKLIGDMLSLKKKVLEIYPDVNVFSMILNDRDGSWEFEEIKE